MAQLELEPFGISDIPRLISWLDSPTAFWNWTGDWLTYPLTVAQYAPKVDETLLDPPTRYIFKAIDVPTKQIAGHFEISSIDREAQTGTIGRVIVSPDLRGQGICGEMIRLAMDFATSHLGLTHLHIQVSEKNTAAIRCYQSAGFNDDGPMWEDTRIRWMSWNSI